MSQVQKDFRNTPLADYDYKTPQREERHLSSKISSKIDDYDFNYEDFAVAINKRAPQAALDGTHHPSEYVFAESRARLDYATNMKDSDIIITNFPKEYSESDVIALCSIKGIKVKASHSYNVVDSDQLASMRLTLQSPLQVKTLQQALHNKWVEDCKIKTFTKAQIGFQSLPERTVILANIPRHYRPNQVKNIAEDYGKVVGIEMIFEDLRIKQHLDNKKDDFRLQREQEIQFEINRAQKLIRESVETQKEYEQFLKAYVGQESAQEILQTQGYKSTVNNQHEEQISVLDSQINLGIQKILNNISSESEELQDSKALLRKLRLELDDDIPSLSSSTNGSQKDTFLTQVDEERAGIKRVVEYLNRNQEQIDDEILSSINERFNLKQSGSSQDTLEKLENLTRLELGEAYDNLYRALEVRTKVLETRYRQTYKHCGLEERILFANRDFKRDQELVKRTDQIFDVGPAPEDFVNISDQIFNVLVNKNLTPEQKLWYLVNEEESPIKDREQANFDEDDYGTSRNEKLAEFRYYPTLLQSNLTNTDLRRMYTNTPLRPEAQEYAEILVEEMRNNFDTPFDELYHKERTMVDNVIRAYNDLKEKQAKLPNPLGENRIIRQGDVPEQVLKESGLHSETQFERDLKLEQQRLLQNNLGSDGDSANFKYLMQHQTEIERQFERGEISKKDYLKYKSMLEQSQRVNLGYAFVTFSNADEAQIFTAVGKTISVDNHLLDTLAQGGVDHKDLDKAFFFNRMKNDARLINEYEKLRDAKQELDNFEKQLDSELPKDVRLKKFREMARDYFENHKFNDRSSIKRTPLEEAELNEKIRDIQRKNPDLDLTQLFDTERNEAIRKAQHKKAFQSYKSFQFLKNGVQFQTMRKQEQQLKEEQQKNGLKAADAYQYPTIDDCIAKFICKDNHFGILPAFEADERVGRRFKYTEQDYLDSYFGKDGVKRLSLDATPEESRSNLFGYNESFKYRYPIEKYLMQPQIDKMQSQLNDKLGIDEGDLVLGTTDWELQRLKDSFNPQNPGHVDVEDYAHPNVPGRTFLGDLEDKMADYAKQRSKVFEGTLEKPLHLGYQRDVETIHKQLIDEYFPYNEGIQNIEAVKDSRPSSKNKEEFETKGLLMRDLLQARLDSQQEGEELGDEIEKLALEDMKEIAALRQREKELYDSYMKDLYRHDDRDLELEDEEITAGSRSEQFKPTYENEKDTNVESQEEYEEMIFADDSVRRANNRFRYQFSEMRSKMKGDYNPQTSGTSVTQEVEKIAKERNERADEYLERAKYRGILDKNENGDGFFTQRATTGTYRNEFDIQSRQRKPQSISNFLDEAVTQADQEEDIYSQYKKRLEQTKQQKREEMKTQAKLSAFVSQEAEKFENEMFPQIPSLKTYFERQSQAKDAIGDEKHLESEDTQKDNQNQLKSDEYFEELFNRELMGRLMGGKLTPRQFAVVYGQSSNPKWQFHLETSQNYSNHASNRKQMSLLLELQEKVKRHAVKTGLCTEAESNRFVDELMHQGADNEDPNKDYITSIRERTQKELQLKMTTVYQRFQEQEYYFDESLGVSVNDHIKQIQEQFPDLEVSVRRDRDNYPAIKTVYKPKFKSTNI